jgi:hypothetical protein
MPPKGAGHGTLMEHIQMIKNESTKEFNRRATMGGNGLKPPVAADRGKGKPNKYDIMAMKDN